MSSTEAPFFADGLMGVVLGQSGPHRLGTPDITDVCIGSYEYDGSEANATWTRVGIIY